MSAVCSDTNRRRLGPAPFLHLSAGWGTSSPRVRDRCPRAADTRDAGFHTSITVAAQQSESKSCGLCCMGRAPVTSLQGEDLDCGDVAAVQYWGVGMPRPACHWQRSEAVAYKHLRAFVAANSGHFEHLLWMFYSFAVNWWVLLSRKQMFFIQINLVLDWFTW